MRYAVVYLSDTGNTKKIAEEIFLALPEGKKKIVDLKKDAFPDADLYFIGFPVKYASMIMEEGSVIRTSAVNICG